MFRDHGMSRETAVEVVTDLGLGRISKLNQSECHNYPQRLAYIFVAMYKTASSAREVVLFDYRDLYSKSGEPGRGCNTASASADDNNAWLPPICVSVVGFAHCCIQFTKRVVCDQVYFVLLMAR